MFKTNKMFNMRNTIVVIVYFAYIIALLLIMN